MLPVQLGRFDIGVLAFLRPAGQQNHKFLSVPAVVHAVSGAEVDPEFRDTLADRFAVAEVAKLDPVDPFLNAGDGFIVLVFEPFTEVVLTVLCRVMNYLNYD